MMNESLIQSKISEFDRNGVILLKEAFTQSDIELLISGLPPTEELGKDFYCLKQNSDNYLCRIMHFHRYASQETLRLMGHPQINSIVSQLCGESFILTADMMIFKHQNCNARIPWHQDFVDNLNIDRIITIGIYLDDSYSNDGGVRFIRGSHKERQNICKFEHKNGHLNDLITLNVEAGDIVIHDPMIVHSSEIMLDQKLRRTLYYEFRSERDVKSRASWPESFLENRKKLYKLAQKAYIEKLPRQDFNKTILQCYESKLPIIPPNYCSCL